MKRREAFSWLWLVALAGATLSICVAMFWAAVPRESRLPLGSVDDFPMGRPEHRALQADTVVYLTSLEGTPVAWDARAPLYSTTRCLFRWVPTNSRFEDPCSGNKWCLDGTIADNRFIASRTLDRYLLVVDRNDNVWLRLDRQATGTPMADVPQSAGHFSYLCDHMR